MKQIFFIDSENVNDLWVNLLDRASEDAEFLVFYTKGSPHMSYASLRKLKESPREVTFIKCYEGTNALDFQMVTELGYRLCETGHQSEEEDMILVTNDNGFDAAVRYWKDRNMLVRRINGQACSTFGEETPVVKLAEVEPAAPETEEPKSNEQKSNEPTQPKKTNDFPKEQVDTLICCFGKKKLAELYNVLIATYGEKGKDYYAIVKPKNYTVESVSWELAEKFKKYIDVVFANLEQDAPKDFAQFLYSSRDKMKNLNTFRAACTKQYGKDKGALYYGIIKPHVKLLASMK